MKVFLEKILGEQGYLLHMDRKLHIMLLKIAKLYAADKKLKTLKLDLHRLLNSQILPAGKVTPASYFV
jgi:hypothetical protein